jgi:hypothetical protein
VANLKFTQAELKINPYTGGEILTFKSADGSIIYFPKGGRKTEVQEFHKYDYETAKLDHKGCQGDYYFSDYNWMVKGDSTSKSALVINLFFRYRLTQPTSEKGFELHFEIYVPELLTFWGGYNFDVDSIMNYKINNSSHLYQDSIHNFFSTFELDSKIFHNVYELYCHNPDSRDTSWISTAYYSVNDGLVGFRTTYGKIWYLAD